MFLNYFLLIVFLPRKTTDIGSNGAMFVMDCDIFLLLRVKTISQKRLK